MAKKTARTPRDESLAPFLVRFPPDLKRRLNAYREAHGVPAGFIVKQAVERWLDAHEGKEHKR